MALPYGLNPAKLQPGVAYALGVLSYPNLIEPALKDFSSPPGPKNPLVYSCDILFDETTPPEIIDGLNRIGTEAATKKFGPDRSKWFGLDEEGAPRKGFKYPAMKPQSKKLTDKRGQPRMGYKAGFKYVHAASKTKPGILDRFGKRIDDDASKVYAGCIVAVTVNAFAYDSNGNRGVSFGLRNVMVVADGTPFGAKAPAPDTEFDAAAPEEAISAGASANDLI